MAKKVRQNSAEAVVRYLRSIDAKLDRLNERLDNFLSAPKRKRAARTGDAGEEISLSFEAEESSTLTTYQP
jgi:hypothetical protein